MITSRAFSSYEFRDAMLCTIAAAVLGGAALSAGASVWGANKAADAQSAAADKSIANQQQMYASNKNMLSPFINAGQGGISNLQNWIDPTSSTNPLSSLIKLTTPGADMSATLAQTPGFQFASGQGTRAALNALAARGLGGSPGAIAKGVSNFNNGLASTQWSNIVQQLMGVQGQETNALQGLVNTGTTAASSLAGVGTNTANQISGAITGAGNAQAAGANATGAAISGLGGGLTTAALVNQLQSGSNGIYGSPNAPWGSSPNYGGGNAFSGDAYGGDREQPLFGLDASDYG